MNKYAKNPTNQTTNARFHAGAAAAVAFGAGQFHTHSSQPS
jgi:hypothetical protein